MFEDTCHCGADAVFSSALQQGKEKMYKQMERAYMFGETPRAILSNEYTSWFDIAVNANKYVSQQ